jgi:hypothetical protein
LFGVSFTAQCRGRRGKATINGVSIADRAKDLQWGREIVDYRASVTVEAISKALAGLK